MKQVKRAVGTPVNKYFVGKIILYAILLFVVVLLIPLALEHFLDAMTYDGLIKAWYILFVPVLVVLMLVSLFRENRRRWGWGFMHKFYQGYRNGNDTCPRCGAPIQRFTEKYQKKVYDYSRTEGNTTINYYHLEDGYITYYRCAGAGCCLRIRDPQYMSTGHIPWKKKELRSLVLNNREGFKKSRTYAQKLLDERGIIKRLLPLIAVIALIVFSLYSYIDGEYGPWNYLKGSRDVARDGAAYQAYMLTLDNSAEAYRVSYTKYNTDFFGKLGGELESYSFSKGKVEGVAYTTYTLSDYDTGTDLPNGRYRLTTVKGESVLIDENKDLIYRSSTDFYKTHAPTLKELSHDKLMGDLIAKTDGGEHGYNGLAEFIRKDQNVLYSYMQKDNPTQIERRVQAAISHPAELQREEYRFDYDVTPNQPDFSEFTYFEEK